MLANINSPFSSTQFRGQYAETGSTPAAGQTLFTMADRDPSYKRNPLHLKYIAAGNNIIAVQPFNRGQTRISKMNKGRIENKKSVE